MGWWKSLARALRPAKGLSRTAGGAGPAGRRIGSHLSCEELEARALLTAGGGLTGGGLQGQYFANPTLSGNPTFTRQDVRVDYNWSGSPDWGNSPVAISGSPSMPFPSTNFSVRWTGQVIPQFSETYTFTLFSAGGARLLINGQTAIDSWAVHAGRSDSRSLALQAGQAYNIELDYVQGGPAAAVQLSWQSPQTPAAVIEPATPLGVNVASLSDYSAQILFADVMKESRRFGSPSTPYDGTAAVDANGWPVQDFGAYILDPAGGVPDGNYALSFTGKAQRVTPVSCSAVIQNLTYNAVTNTTTATVSVHGQSALSLAFTGTQRTTASPLGSGLTNVRLMLPTSPGSPVAYATSVTFNPTAERVVAPFTTLRMMDFTRTNNSPQTDWSTRTLPSAAQLTFGPWEYAVQFANETGKDIWINVPAQATDTYITNLADLLAYGSDGVNPYTSPQAHPVFPGLNSNLKVYVEYSNEVWNYMFQQAQQNLNAAIAEVRAGNSPLNYDGSTNQGVWAQRRVAEQVVRISTLFRSVFGDGQMMTRVRPLLEWQAGNGNGTASQALNFLYNYYGGGDGRAHGFAPHPVTYYVWGGGGGWYFGVNNGSGLGEVTVPDGGFEDGTQVGPVPWAFSGSAGVVANGSAMGNPSAPEGTHAAYIQGSGSFSQTVSFNGGPADLIFYAAEGTSGSESFDIYFDGALIARDWRPQWTPDHTTYDLYRTRSIATTAGPHTIRFVGTGGSGTVFLDGVRAETVNAMYNSGMVSPSASVAADAQWAHAFGLRVVNYEGGFSIGGDNATDLQENANLDPRARNFEVQGTSQVFQAGSDLAMMFTLAGYTAYGLASPNIYARNTPKLQAVNVLTGQLPVGPTGGTALPSAVGQAVALPSENSYFNPSTSLARLYALQFSSPGTYTVSLYGNQGSAAGLTHLLLDGVRVPGSVSLPYWQQAPAYSVPLTITITTPGLHVLSLVVDGPGQLHLMGGTITRTLTVADAGFDGSAGASWAFAGTSGIAANGSALTAGNPVAPDGAQVAYLAAGASISQLLSGWAAGTYQVSLFAAQRAGNTVPQDFQILVDGVVVGTFTPAGTAYAQYVTPSFTVGAGSHTVQLRTLNSRGGNGTVLLDEIGVLPVK